MKRSELKQLIKEEIKSILAEGQLDYLKGTRFNYMGWDHWIRKIEYSGDKISLKTTDGKYFNYNMLVNNGVKFVEKPQRKSTTSWNKGNKRLTRREYESKLKQMIGGLEGEDHSIFFDQAENLYTSDAAVRDYLDKVYGIRSKSYGIEQVTNDMEMFAEGKTPSNKTTLLEDEYSNVIFKFYGGGKYKGELELSYQDAGNYAFISDFFHGGVAHIRKDGQRIKVTRDEVDKISKNRR